MITIQCVNLRLACSSSSSSGVASPSAYSGRARARKRHPSGPPDDRPLGPECKFRHRKLFILHSLAPDWLRLGRMRAVEPIWRQEGRPARAETGNGGPGGSGEGAASQARLTASLWGHIFSLPHWRRDEMALGKALEHKASMIPLEQQQQQQQYANSLLLLAEGYS